MRFQETSAFCTALKSLATLEDLTTSLVKQERKVVKAAISQLAPAGAQHILCAEPQDEEGPCLGCRQIKRRQSGLPHVVPHGSLFVKAQGLLVFFHPGLLAAVDAVGHGIPGTVQRGTAQGTGGLFIGRTGTLHRLFHPCRADIGHRE